MDQQTFDELIKDGEISLILMDGGYDLTDEQREKVKEVAKQQSREKLLRMAAELATSPGYKEFVSMPLVGAIMAGRRKPRTPEQVEKEREDRIQKVDSKKDPNFNTIAEGVVRPLKVKDSASDILGKMYNFGRIEYARELKSNRAENKFRKKLEHLKEERNDELISLFTGQVKGKKGKLSLSEIGRAHV